MNTLAEYLKEKNETQKSFAERLGVHQSTVSRIASGKYIPSPKMAEVIEWETNGYILKIDLLYPESGRK